MLLHGQPGSASDWQQVTDLLPGGLVTVALDRPGYGASRQAAGGFAANARAILAELDARGIERAVLVGHSFGGGVALALAQLAPERVEALVLLASVGPDCLTGWDRLLAAPVAGEVCAVAAWWLTPWLARASLAVMARRRAGPSPRTSTSTCGSGAAFTMITGRCGAASLPNNARWYANSTASPLHWPT